MDFKDKIFKLTDYPRARFRTPVFTPTFLWNEGVIQIGWGKLKVFLNPQLDACEASQIWYRPALFRALVQIHVLYIIDCEVLRVQLVIL